MGLFDDRKSTMGSTPDDSLANLPEQDTNSDVSSDEVEYLKNELERSKEALEISKMLKQELEGIRDLLRDSRNKSL